MTLIAPHTQAREHEQAVLKKLNEQDTKVQLQLQQILGLLQAQRPLAAAAPSAEPAAQP